MKNILILCLTFCLFAFTQGDTHNWVQKADFGGGKIYDAASFVIGKYAYVATGSDNAFYGNGFKRFMYRYDPSLDVWKRMADLPPAGAATMNAVGFAIGEKGYVCGGVDNAAIWEYDPSSNLWYQRINFPRIIEEGIGFAISSKAYIGLGGASIIDYKNDFYEYDPSKNKCTQLNDFPGAPRRGSIGFSLNGKGYAGLGYKDIGSYNKGYFKDLWEYDPLTDDWTRLPDFPGEARQDAIGFGIDGAIYVGMGGINDFYKYDLKTKEWSTLNYIPGNSRVYAFSFSIGSGIYYGGGMSPNLASDMWKYSIGAVTSTAKNLETEDFKCFPNPVIDRLEIEMLDNHTIAKIKLTDMSGKVVVAYENRNMSITQDLNLSSLRNGYYTITIEDQDRNLFTKKLLKSK
jgi:N-acetylneuraminic acid mutarotase